MSRNLVVLPMTLALLLHTTGCIPTSNQGLVKPSKSGSAAAYSTQISTDGAGNGAYGQCALIDPSSPERSICVTCYDNVLSSRCPGASDPSLCADRAVSENFTSYVNQCISATRLAGFTCSRSCSNGLILEPTTCTCVSPPPASGSGTTSPGSGDDNGQFNAGPPTVTVSWPSIAATGTANSSSTGSCKGSITSGTPITLLIKNRGDTVFSMNSYGSPVASGTTACAEDMITPTVTNRFANANAYTGFTFKSSTPYLGDPVNTAALDTLSNGTPGLIQHVSGTGTAQSAAHAVAASGASWAFPHFGARDGFGNLYFSDRDAGTLHVLCYNNTASATNNPWCNGKTVGYVYRIATGLNSPAGVAIYQDSNKALPDSFVIYFAESGKHVISKCTFNAGTCDVVTYAGIDNSRGYVQGAFGVAKFNNPMGIDLEENAAGDMNLYVADQNNHAIRAVCGFSAANRPCFGHANEVISIAGRGPTANGYAGDEAAPQTSEKLYAPTDVKINWNGNLFFADMQNDRIRAVCYDHATGDACGLAQETSPTGLAVVIRTIAGTDSVVSSSRVPISKPFALALPKGWGATSTRGDVDYTGTLSKFRDNNIAFTEKYSSTTGSDPTTIPNLLSSLGTSVSAVAAGGKHTCIKTGSNAKCWGGNDAGQVGNDSTQESVNPATVLKDDGSPLSNVSKVAAGESHSCAVLSSGAAYCWGQNQEGQLGLDSNGNQKTKADQVADVSNFSSIKLGSRHSCGVSSGGALYCWGRNKEGQVGVGSGDDFKDSPKKIYDDKVTQFAVGNNHACAIHDGELKCWGENGQKQLGDTTTTDRSSPADVDTTGLTESNFTLLSAGASHTCATYDAGGGSYTVYCWGDNSHLQLGRSTTDALQLGKPTAGREVFGLSGAITQIVSGKNHNCVRLSDGSVRCWGDNSFGQLGDGTNIGKYAPVEVIGLQTGVAELSAGANHTCARMTTGELYCWGDSDNGQTGPLSPQAVAKGNTVSILCGDTLTISGSSSTGLCSGYPKGYILRLAGLPGIVGAGGDGLAADQSSLASVQGLTYDAFKNLIVASTAMGSAAEYGLRAIKMDRNFLSDPGQRCGIKYTFTDSRQRTSYYCLRFRVLTNCGDFSGGKVTCSCRAEPVNVGDQSFWFGLQESDTCD